MNETEFLAQLLPLQVADVKAMQLGDKAIAFINGLDPEGGGVAVVEYTGAAAAQLHYPEMFHFSRVDIKNVGRQYRAADLVEWRYKDVTDPNRATKLYHYTDALGQYCPKYKTNHKYRLAIKKALENLDRQKLITIYNDLL